LAAGNTYDLGMDAMELSQYLLYEGNSIGFHLLWDVLSSLVSLVFQELGQGLINVLAISFLEELG